MTEPYTISLIPCAHWRSENPPRPKYVLHCPPDGSGYKTRAMWLAESFNGKWSKKRGGYVMSKRGVERFQEALVREEMMRQCAG